MHVTEIKQSFLQYRQVATMKTIEDLPDEILLIIFSKLDLRSITRAGGTCRRWRHPSKDGKTIQYIAKHAFDYQEWIQHDFLPKQDDIYLAKILGIFSLNGEINFSGKRILWML